MKVAVIGAGAAGLAALRHLTSRPSQFTAVAYEMTSRVGGTWVYNENTGTDEHGLPIHSSMYKNLITNLPKEIMAFPDFPFPKNGPSFVKHEEVLKYLENYADHFNLSKHIKFNTLVQNISPLKSGNDTKWQISVKKLPQDGAAAVVEEFDAVVIANGHYSVPYIPDLAGLEDFRGRVLHSHDYRHPEDFKNKMVLCLGAGPSGLDISLELADHASQVYLAHKKDNFIVQLPDNVHLTCGVQRMVENGVILEDGRQLDVDVLLLTTGYLYNFPFLSKDIHFEIDEERLYPLYKHVIHAEHPSLSFLGVDKYVIPFVLIHYQVLFTLAVWDGTITLPSEAEMKDEIQKEFKEILDAGMPKRYTHTILKTQWDYYRTFAKMAGVPPPPNVFQKVFEYLFGQFKNNFCNFRLKNIEIENDEEFKVVVWKPEVQ